MNVGEHVGLPMAEYLALPALSHGVVQAMIEECPRAAWFQSWLNTGRPRDDATKEIDTGQVAHSVLLENSWSSVEFVNPLDHPNEKGGGTAQGWTNKSIKAKRDEIRAAAKIPLLIHAKAEISNMVDAAREYIESLRESEPAIWRAFQPDGGQSEVSMLFDWDGTLCRMRPDRVSTDRKLFIHYKTTAMSVEPNRWARSQLFGGYDLTAAFYGEGAFRLFGEHPSQVFLVQQTAAPYLCSLVGLDPGGTASANAEIMIGVRMWNKCVAANRWPGHPSRVCYVDAPAYLLAQREERQITGGINYAEQG